MGPASCGPGCRATNSRTPQGPPFRLPSGRPVPAAPVRFPRRPAPRPPGPDCARAGAHGPAPAEPRLSTRTPGTPADRSRPHSKVPGSWVVSGAPGHPPAWPGETGPPEPPCAPVLSGDSPPGQPGPGPVTPRRTAPPIDEGPVRRAPRRPGSSRSRSRRSGARPGAPPARTTRADAGRGHPDRGPPAPGVPRSRAIDRVPGSSVLPGTRGARVCRSR